MSDLDVEVQMGSLDVGLYVTTNYGQFKRLPYNRTIDKHHVNRLALAIRENNLTPVNPVIVTEDGFIVEGQHRIEAFIKIEADYGEQLDLHCNVIKATETDGKTLSQLQSLHSTWNVRNYLDLHLYHERPEYVRFQKLHNRVMDVIDIKRMVGLVAGKYSRSDVKQEKLFKDGFYQHKNGDFVLMQADLYRLYKECDRTIDFVTYQNFKTALTFSFLHAGCTMEKHKENVNRIMSFNTHLDPNGRSITDFMQALDGAFNYGRMIKNHTHILDIYEGKRPRIPLSGMGLS